MSGARDIELGNIDESAIDQRGTYLNTPSPALHDFSAGDHVQRDEHGQVAARHRYVHNYDRRGYHVLYFQMLLTLLVAMVCFAIVLAYGVGALPEITDVSFFTGLLGTIVGAWIMMRKPVKATK